MMIEDYTNDRLKDEEQKKGDDIALGVDVKKVEKKKFENLKYGD